MEELSLQYKCNFFGVSYDDFIRFCNLIKEINFSGLDLAAMNLTGLKFKKVIFNNTDLSYSLIKDSSMDEVRIANSKLFCTKFINTKFNEFTLKNTTAYYVIIGHSEILKASFINTNFYSAEFHSVNLNEFSVSKGVFLKANFVNIAFGEQYKGKILVKGPDGIIDKSNFTGASFVNCTFFNNLIKESNLEKTYISKSFFTSSNFEDVRLFKAQIISTEFSYGNLYNVNASFIDTDSFILDTVEIKKLVLEMLSS